jgi:hypothetical protein
VGVRTSFRPASKPLPRVSTRAAYARIEWIAKHPRISSSSKHQSATAVPKSNILTCAIKIFENALPHIREIHYASNLTPTLIKDADPLQGPMLTRLKGEMTEEYTSHGEDHPPATSTHSARQLPCLPSTSTISVSHLHRQPTPFSLTGSGIDQYSSSS